MPRTSVIATFAGVFVGIFVILQFISSIHEPQQPPLFGLVSDTKPSSSDNVNAADDIYILGAGKADITG
jgi:hypothetical protein